MADASRPRRDCPPSARSHWPCRALDHRALYFAGRSSRARVRLASGAWAWATARGCRTLIGSSRAVRRGSPIPKGCRCCRQLSSATAARIALLDADAPRIGSCGRPLRTAVQRPAARLHGLSLCNQWPAVVAPRHARDIRCAIVVLASPSRSALMVVSGSDGSALIDPSRRPRPLTPLVDRDCRLSVRLQTPIAAAHFDPLHSPLHSLSQSWLLAARSQPPAARLHSVGSAAVHFPRPSR